MFWTQISSACFCVVIRGELSDCCTWECWCLCWQKHEAYLRPHLHSGADTDFNRGTREYLHICSEWINSVNFIRYLGSKINCSFKCLTCQVNLFLLRLCGSKKWQSYPVLVQYPFECFIPAVLRSSSCSSLTFSDEKFVCPARFSLMW